jgi:hypothetical protein
VRIALGKIRPDKTHWLAAWIFNAAPMSVSGQKQTHTLHQKASYSILVRVVMLETAYGGLKQRECDFRKNERDESKAIIRATGKKKTRKKFQAFVHSD